MKDYTVVNEVETLQQVCTARACVCVSVWSTCVSVLQCVRWGFVYQEVTVIMLPSRTQVFQPECQDDERGGEVRYQWHPKNTLRMIHFISRTACL